MRTTLQLLVTALTAIAIGLLLVLALHASGIAPVAYIELPLVLFVTTLVIWPVATRLLGLAGRQRFADWATLDAALTLLVGLILWSIATLNSASPFLDELSH